MGKISFKWVQQTMPPLMYHDSQFLQFNKLDQDQKVIERAYAVVVLNYQMPLFTPFLWDKACIRLCADGGANQLYDFLPSLLPHEDPAKIREQYKPDVIQGDLDSIRPEVKNFYAALGTKIIDESHDQDTTDLHKCISYIKDKTPHIEKFNVKILVLGAVGGRLDHVFANFNVLYSFANIQIILLSDDSMAFLLAKDFAHEIHIDPSIEGPHCGLVPLGGPSFSTTTTGLKWNLNKSAMQFGGLISTCNIYEKEIVTVLSDTNLVWTISIQKLNKRLSQRIAAS